MTSFLLAGHCPASACIRQAALGTSIAFAEGEREQTINWTCLTAPMLQPHSRTHCELAGVPEMVSPQTTHNKLTSLTVCRKKIHQKCWRWIGHTLRKPVTYTTRQALTWSPQEKREQGEKGKRTKNKRKKTTWFRDLEAETKRMGYIWGQLERLALNSDAWRALVGSRVLGWVLRPNETCVPFELS